MANVGSWCIIRRTRSPLSLDTSFIEIVCAWHNPRLTKGVVATPFTFFPGAQNLKESDLGHVSDLLYILCGHFEEKSSGYHLTRGKSKPSKSEGEGLVKPGNIRNHCFEKYLHSMVLNLTLYVRNVISLFYKKNKTNKQTNKKRRNSDI